MGTVATNPAIKNPTAPPGARKTRKKRVAREITLPRSTFRDGFDAKIAIFLTPPPRNHFFDDF